MQSRAIRLIVSPDYRRRVIQVLPIYLRHPKAVSYKTYGYFANKMNRVGERIRNRRLVQCNVCDWSGNRFDAIATIGYVRRNARCPVCGSMERHRAMLETLRNDQFLERGMRLLDVGGIPAFRQALESRGLKYVSLSLGDPAMVCMDVERLGFPDECFDFVIDSHVLEYVSDYHRALNELWRVLRSGGRMLLTEAYVRGQSQTIEFGKPNPVATFMVRRFGDDLFGFLRSVGFEVDCWDHTGRNDERGDYFFLCTKPLTQSRRAHVA